MTTDHARLLVFSSPRSASEERAFDEWYDQVHIPQVVEMVAGIVSGQRFVLSLAQLGGDFSEGPRRRLTIYEVEAGQVAKAVTRLGTAMRDGSLDQTDLIDRASAPPEVVVYEAG